MAYDTLQNNCLVSRSKKKNLIMKNVMYKKIWRNGAVQLHVEPPPIPLIIIKYYAKSEKDCIKLNCVGILRQKIGLI